MLVNYQLNKWFFFKQQLGEEFFIKDQRGEQFFMESRLKKLFIIKNQHWISSFPNTRMIAVSISKNSLGKPL